MDNYIFYEKIFILKNSEEIIKEDSVLIINGKINAFGKDAQNKALEKKIISAKSGNKILAPLLVDMHSTLEDPISGFEDNLISLKKRAKKSGFGTIALIPNGIDWRDKSEKIPFQINKNDDINIFFWGGFSINDAGKTLSDHEALLKSGVIGLSSSCFNDFSIIVKGISLIESNFYPILLNTNKNYSDQREMILEDIKALQAGLRLENNFNCILDIKKILEIKKYFPTQKIIIKNISDINSCNELEKNNAIFSTVSWWNLVADTGNLEFNDIGWKADPPIGNSYSREYLINALENDLIQAIAVNSLPLNDQETFKPTNERRLGISSYELVLPLLWEELISKRKWSISKLWRHLSFLPSNLLNLPEEKLQLGSKRWIIFDPDKSWINSQTNLGYDSPSNIPKKNKSIKGKIISYGLEF